MAKKSKETEKDKNQESESPIIDANLLSRIFSPIKILFKMHLKIAQDELKKDFSRYISGVINFLLFIVLIITFWLLLNLLGIIFIKQYFNIDILYSILIITLINLFFSIIMIASAIAKFKKPFLKETKKLIDETIKELKK